VGFLKSKICIKLIYTTVRGQNNEVSLTKISINLYKVDVDNLLSMLTYSFGF
jgi:hypothetical protein